EIAEQRSEMFNLDDPITPDADQYRKAVDVFIRQMQVGKKNNVFFQRLNHTFRLVYYDLAVRILKERRQVIPCYAGISNAHMTPYGDIWPCCTLGYDKSMGNLRDFDYNFTALWNSSKAKEVRHYIRQGICHCPLANQMYSNILMHPPSLMKATKYLLFE
ncbi:MAG: SPASM domain-containing protein, partial [Candidatus Omnitrophota bacterium]